MNPRERSLAVVVVAYGNPDLLQACLRALEPPAGHLVVVDNGRDERVRRMCGRWEGTYVLPATNEGYAAGVNRGVAAVTDADADVLLLNPDASLSWHQACDLHDRLLSSQRTAAVAPRLHRPDGSVERSLWPMPSPWSIWLDALGGGRMHRGRSFLNGAVLLLRRSALRAVGPFDERFFLYGEEADWQLRAQRAGWQVELCRQISACHLGGATSDEPSRRDAHFYRSAILFAEKWYGWLGAWNARTASAVARGRRRIVSGRSG